MDDDKCQNCSPGRISGNGFCDCCVRPANPYEALARQYSTLLNERAELLEFREKQLADCMRAMQDTANESGPWRCRMSNAQWHEDQSIGRRMAVL